MEFPVLKYSLVSFTIAIVLFMKSTAQVVTIGAVLSSNDNEIRFKDVVDGLKDESWILPSLQFNSSSLLMDANPIRSALSICDDLMADQVSAVIVSHPPDATTSPIAVSYTCGYYKIPVIGIYARDSSFSDKKVHSLFVRTVPPYSHQVDIWMALLNYFDWNKVVFIHSADEEGWAIRNRFQSLISKLESPIEIEKMIKFPTGMKSYTENLQPAVAVQSRVILLYANAEDAEYIFKSANALNLTSLGYAWIVTEQALNAPNAPIGTLGVSLMYVDNEHYHLIDAVKLLSRVFDRIYREHNITAPPTHCRDNTIKWRHGQLVYNYLRAEVYEDGKTGNVAFDENGDRLHAVYQIRNVHFNLASYNLAVAGIYGSTQADLNPPHLLIEDSKIIYPGNTTEKPPGIKLTTHLRVVTLGEKPFIHKHRAPPEECNFEQSREIPCPHYNKTTGVTTEYCCKGYCIDMLLMLKEDVGFDYDLHLGHDGFYGNLGRYNGSKEKVWNGMVAELLNDESDMILAPLTINPERTSYIDFTKPFKYQGLTILVRKITKESSLASFLQPFQGTLWILVGLSVHVVALVLYLLDRFSPFGRFKLAKSDDTEEDALNLSSAMWFAWGVILNSGIGEGTPRSFSARVLGMVWAGFAMIIVASYTANLAAFLVLDRPEASISGIDDARLRNPQDTFKFATVKNSAAEMYFKRQVELSTMFRAMADKNKDNADVAIQAVRDKDLDAFIWDSSRLEYEASQDCMLVTAGELFGRSGYGIGLRKHSPWYDKISQAILRFHEGGKMEGLDTQWILADSAICEEKDSTPATLGLTNMAGVFMMVAGGIVAGIILIFMEIAYKRHRGLKDKELELARNAADRWRGNIEKRKILRQTRDNLAKKNKLPQSSSTDKLGPIMRPSAAENRVSVTGGAAEPEEEAKRRTLRKTMQQQRDEQLKRDSLCAAIESGSIPPGPLPPGSMGRPNAVSGPVSNPPTFDQAAEYPTQSSPYQRRRVVPMMGARGNMENIV